MCIYLICQYWVTTYKSYTTWCVLTHHWKSSPKKGTFTVVVTFVKKHSSLLFYQNKIKKYKHIYRYRLISGTNELWTESDSDRKDEKYWEVIGYYIIHADSHSKHCVSQSAVLYRLSLPCRKHISHREWLNSTTNYRAPHPVLPALWGLFSYH